MGPGAIGSITSAVTVAVSSFNMTITDPVPLLEDINMTCLQEFLEHVGRASNSPTAASLSGGDGEKVQLELGSRKRILTGKVQTLGDFIDTDALAPAEALLNSTSAEEIGKYCLYHTHPDFRRRLKEDGHNIVVACKAFGVGSSRENAVTALQGAGVLCVIARSFGFIYARNQPNLGLLGIVIEDEKFYEVAEDGANIEIDVIGRTLEVNSITFNSSISDLEIKLWEQGGMTAAFAKWGKGLLEAMTGSKASSGHGRMEKIAEGGNLYW